MKPPKIDWREKSTKIDWKRGKNWLKLTEIDWKWPWRFRPEGGAKQQLAFLEGLFSTWRGAWKLPISVNGAFPPLTQRTPRY